MGRISTTFKRLRWESEAALIPSVVVGYPSLQTTRQIVPLMARQGADLIELVVPSLRLPGATNSLTLAASLALQNGITIYDCLDVAAEARRQNEVPLILTIDAELLDPASRDEFLDHCKAAGIDGVAAIKVKDEDRAGWDSSCMTAQLDPVFMYEILVDDKYIRQLANDAKGILYHFIDPNDDTYPEEMDFGHALNVSKEKPGLACITRAHEDSEAAVQSLASIVDGVVVGDGLVQLIQSLDEDDLIGGVAEYVRELKAATIGQKGTS